jgi:hypothetical protein
MDFRIADTFTASLGRLNGAEQKAVKMVRASIGSNDRATQISGRFASMKMSD